MDVAIPTRYCHRVLLILATVGACSAVAEIGPAKTGAYVAARGEAAKQSGAELPRAEKVVKARAYVSREPVARGDKFEVAVVAEILPGFHINANEVLQDYLIPTSVEAEVPRGVRQVGVNYPPGRLQKFEFSEEKMSVYDGSIKLRMTFEAGTDAPLGARTLPLLLRYQACNDTTCLPPARIPLAAQIEIVPRGTKTRAINPKVFSSR